jgi:hypothetical protein
MKRPIRSSWPGVIMAFLGVLAGLGLNIAAKVSIVYYFALYMVVFLVLSMTMFVRVRLLRIGFNLLKNTRFCRGRLGKNTKQLVKRLNNQAVVFFTKHGLLSVLNKAITYIRDNEFTDDVIICHLYSEEDGNLQGGSEKDELLKERVSRIRTNVRILDRMYPKSRISLLIVQGKFGKEAVAKISEQLGIPRNFFFMASPTAGFDVQFQDLGGVRIITH